MPHGTILILLLTATACPAAWAEVYRCTVDGKTVYSDRPCDAKATPLAIPVSPATAPAAVTRDLAKENADTDARIRKKVAADLAERQAYRAEQDRFMRKCQGYRYEILRQQAWLNATSTVVRQSAAAEISIQRRNLSRDGCDTQR